MMNRKMVALAAAALLAFSVTASAAAATVPSAVYGGKGENSSQQEITTGLTTYGVKDVKADDWYAGSTVTLLQAGLIQPSTTGELNANAPMQADAALSIFAKALGLASKTDDEATAAAKAKQAGFSGATSADGTLSRLQFAKMLATVLGVKPATSNILAFKDTLGLSAEDNAILLALKEAGYVKGYEDGTFRANESLTLAQVAVLVDRILSAK